MKLMYSFIKILIFIIGVILVISPKKMINYFAEKDLKNLKDRNENINRSILIENIKKYAK